MINIEVDGETYRILDKKYYDHMEWTYPKDEKGFLHVDPFEYAEWVKKNATKITNNSVAA